MEKVWTMIWEKITGLFKKKHTGKVLDDESRLRSAETRKLQAEIAALRKQVDMKSELQSMRELLSGDIEGKADNSLEQQFLNVIMGKLGQQPQQSLNTSIPVDVGSSNKDAELKEIADKLAAYVPKQYIPIIQNYSDEELIKIKNHLINKQ